MRKLGFIFAVALTCYFIVWSLLYFSIMGTDTDFYFEYLRLAWTKPGERPAVMQLVSLAVTAFVVVVVSLVVVAKSRRPQ